MLKSHIRSLIPILIIVSLILSMFPVPAESQSQQLAFATTVSNAAAGNTYYVSLSGSDSNLGTQSQPFRTIQHAADVAQPGNRILVKAGTYYERIALKNSGRAGSPIVIEGERGASGERLAVIDGSDPITGWVPASSTYGGLWRTSSVPYEIGWLGVDDGTATRHILAMTEPYVNRTSLADLDLPADYLVGKSYITDHMKVLYWDGFEALWTGGNPAYVRFRHGDDPNSKNMRASPRYGATLRLDNVHHLTLKHLRVRGAFYTVHVTSTAADIIIEDNELTNGASTLAVFGAHRITIRNNLIYHNRVPTLYKPGASNVPQAEYGTTPTPGTWQYAGGIAAQMNWWWKIKSWEEGIAINTVYDEPQLKPGIHDSEISGNVITDYPAFTISLANSTNLKISHNDLSHTGDAGIVFGHVMTGIEIFDNYFHDDCINLRVGMDPHQQEVYVYRNRFDQPAQPGGRLLFYCCPPGDGTEVNYNHKRYFYHNSFVGSDRAATGLGKNDFRNADYYLNNVFSAQSVFDWDTGAFNPGLALFDYNWMGGGQGTTYIAGEHPSGQLVIGPHTIKAYGQQQWTAKAWDSTIPTNFTLPAAARNAGIDVTSAAATSLVGRSTPLPGFAPGYFTGAAPNMGVYQDIDTPQTFNFSLSNGGNRSVTRGSSVSNTISATLISGTAQSVSYVVFGLPSGVTASFSPNSCSPTCSTTLTLNASASAASGTFLITVSATGGGAPKTTTFNLIGVAGVSGRKFTVYP